MSSTKQNESIKKFYEDALVQIKAGNFKEANDVIHNKMGTKLYDLALDLVYSTNVPVTPEKGTKEYSENKLRKLINKVDKALCTESVSGFDKDDLDKPLIVNSDDEQWFSSEFL